MSITQLPGRARLAVFMALSSTALLGLGCATSHSPLPQLLDSAGVPHSYKRVERYPQRDFMHHLVRTAYCKPVPPWGVREGTEEALHGVQNGTYQATVIKELGRPDWVRKPFTSLQNETVHEWLYINQNRLFQFIGPQQVFDGPITDYEQTLLSRGYPDQAYEIYSNDGTHDDIFTYERVFWPVMEEFHFVEGKLVQSKEGN